MPSIIGLTIGLFAWVTFIYAQYKYGDRPTSEYWFAAMISLGTFEYAKAMLTMVEIGLDPILLAMAAAGLTGAALLAQQLNAARGSDEGVLENLVGLHANEVFVSEAV